MCANIFSKSNKLLVSTSMYFKWESTLYSKFQVTNDVRQGGVLSPLLFNVYVNDNDNEIHLFKPNFIYTIDNTYCL